MTLWGHNLPRAFMCFSLSVPNPYLMSYLSVPLLYLIRRGIALPPGVCLGFLGHSVRSASMH